MEAPENNLWTTLFQAVKKQVARLWKGASDLLQNLRDPEKRKIYFRWLRRKINRIDWKEMLAKSRAFMSRLWTRAKSIEVNKEEFRKISNRAKGLAEEKFSEENREKLKIRAKELKEKAHQLREEAAPLTKKAGEKLRASKEFASQRLMELSDQVQQHQTKKKSEPRSDQPLHAGFTEKWVQWFAEHSWVKFLTDKWLGLPIWKSEKLLTRYLIPILAFSSIFLIIGGISLYSYITMNISNTREEIKEEATSSLLQNIYSVYHQDVAEKSASLEQLVLDNITKTAIVADAPTFKDLNIQKMEEFSRSLLRKDSNLLNVVVLAPEETKKLIRTRRIGDTTRFLFTCCEIPDDRAIDYREVQEKSWLAEINNRKSAVSDLYVNPKNGERYFYHARTIEDIRQQQIGAVLLRYNLNFAVRTLRKSPQLGLNFLIANDSVIVATSQDTIYPALEVSQFSNEIRPPDYVISVINLIRTAASEEEAISLLMEARFIEDPIRFQREFSPIIKDPLVRIIPEDSLQSPTWLNEEQARAIMNLSFGQLLGLSRALNQGGDQPTELSIREGQLLVEAYQDSIRKVGTGIIKDDAYLLVFSTNQFGWTLVNQSYNSEYLAPVIAKESFILNRFSDVVSNIFWFLFFTGLFSLLIFLIMVSGLLQRVIRPISSLAEEVAKNGERLGIKRHTASQSDEIGSLSQSFASLTEELEEYIQQLEMSNRDLEQYAHLVAHDLKQPVRTIRGFLQLLFKKNHEKFDKTSQEYIQFILDGTERMDTLIRQILEYASITKSLADSKSSEVEVSKLIENASKNLQALISESNATIEVQDMPKLSAPPELLQTVLQNLIENAIKYQDPDKTPNVILASQKREKGWLITVADNGKGIRPEDQHAVFEMFNRIDPQDEKGGTGIGLASCRKILNYLGGNIWVESKGAGEGSTFFLYVPETPPTRKAPAPAGVSTEQPQAPEDHNAQEKPNLPT